MSNAKNYAPQNVSANTNIPKKSTCNTRFYLEYLILARFIGDSHERK